MERTAPEGVPATQEAIGGLPFTGEVDVTVVNVNVYVTDKQGFAVTDLTADDFVLTQDGTAKAITNFGLFTDEIYRSYYRATKAADRPADTDPDPRRRRPFPRTVSVRSMSCSISTTRIRAPSIAIDSSPSCGPSSGRTSTHRCR